MSPLKKKVDRGIDDAIVEIGFTFSSAVGEGEGEGGGRHQRRQTENCVGRLHSPFGLFAA